MLDLPLNNFAWGDTECVENIEFFFKTRSEAFEAGGVMMSWNEFFGESNKSTGYFIECDLSYSDKAKLALRDFPPAPCHTSVTHDILSDFAKSRFHEYEGADNVYTGGEKLMCTFEVKKGYVIHSRLADYYTSIGLCSFLIYVIIKKYFRSSNLQCETGALISPRAFLEVLGGKKHSRKKSCYFDRRFNYKRFL